MDKATSDQVGPGAAGGEGCDAGVPAGTVYKSGNGWETTDPVQNKTAAMLHRRVPRARTAYLGALYALQQDEYPDQMVHAAHSLREVIDLLARSKQEERERKSPLKHDQREALLQAEFDLLALLVPRVDHVSSDLVALYSRLSEIAHHGGTTAEEMADMLSSLEKALDTLDAPQLAVNKEMDDMLLRQPSEELARQLTGMQHRRATQIKLAESLTPEWLPYMKEAGYFSEPQPANASNRSFYYIWPPSLYLRSCTRQFGAEVAEIIMTVKFKDESGRNPAVYTDFLACACDLPLPDAERIAAKAVKEGWCGFTDIIMHDKGYLELASRLYLGGRHDIAGEMFFSLLKAKMLEASAEDERQSEPQRFAASADAEWFAEELREKMLPLAKSCPWPVMDLLGCFLDEVDKHGAQRRKRAKKAGDQKGKQVGKSKAEKIVSELRDQQSDWNDDAWSLFQRQMADFVTSFVVDCIRPRS